jgi:predicted dehydrogenase
MSHIIHWGIIGCGDVTEIKSGPALQKAADSELVAVMRRNNEKAADYARRHGVARWYDDADKLINDAEVDAVYIATPPETHKIYTERVARAGKPVYVEKPMARSYAECCQMIEICQKNNVPLFVAFYRRSLPRFLKVKELLENQIIGKVRSVLVRLYLPQSADEFIPGKLPWRVIPQLAGGGLFFDLASHTLDILDFYFGPVSAAQGYAANQMSAYTAEDIVSASFKFENDIVGNGMWCFNTSLNEDLIEIIGEKGKIIIPTFASVPLKAYHDDIEESWDIKHPAHIQQPHIQSIVDELHSRGKCPCHGEDGARTAWVMDRITELWRREQGIQFK